MRFCRRSTTAARCWLRRCFFRRMLDMRTRRRFHLRLGMMFRFGVNDARRRRRHIANNTTDSKTIALVATFRNSEPVAYHASCAVALIANCPAWRHMTTIERVRRRSEKTCGDARNCKDKSCYETSSFHFSTPFYSIQYIGCTHLFNGFIISHFDDSGQLE